MKRAIRNETFADLRYKLRRKGSKVWSVISFNNSPVVDSDGQVSSVILTIRKMVETSEC